MDDEFRIKMQDKRDKLLREYAIRDRLLQELKEINKLLRSDTNDEKNINLKTKLRLEAELSEVEKNIEEFQNIQRNKNK